MKKRSEVKEELIRANSKLTEIEREVIEVTRRHDDLSVCDRFWQDTHGYIEALYWVLGDDKGSNIMLRSK